MKILCIHQNFPGQYKHLAPALARQGHHVVALTPKVEKAVNWNGIHVVPYKVQGNSTRDIHPWLADFETKIIRGQSCYAGAMQLKQRGYAPDMILAHHGWGESLFLKDVWPEARMGLYCELYHRATPEFVGFDPEFPTRSPETDSIRLRLKNLNNRLHEEVMDAGISPTRFQAETFPEAYQDRITVCHDGVNTDSVVPNPEARLDVGGGRVLTREDEVITFINRNLEPYRGYHVFMRALPELLRRRPEAQVVLLGGDETSYGAKPPGDASWKQIFIDEVRPKIPDEDWARVHFLGRVPYATYLSMIQVSTVHVYLTYPFVLSWSLLEAMSAGALVVGSRTAPVEELIRDGVTGRLVDFFDTAEIAETLIDGLADPVASDPLRAAARALIVENYDLKRLCLPRLIGFVEGVA